MKMKITLIAILCMVMSGCAATQPSLASASLNDQNQKAAETLVDHDDPKVAATAADIAANAEVIAKTDYSEFQPALVEADIPYSAAFSKEKREEKITESENSSTLLGWIQGAVKRLPFGETALTLIAAGYAWYKRREVQRWITLARTTFQSVENKGSTELKKELMDRHGHANVGDLADKIVETIKPSEGSSET